MAYMEVRDHLSGRERAEGWRFGPLAIALTAYAATFALGALWALKEYAKHEWLPARIILRDLLLGGFFLGFPILPILCLGAMTVSLVYRRRVFGVVLGCGAIAVWVLAGFLLCSLHIT